MENQSIAGMKVLLAAATDMEVKLLTDECRQVSSISENLRAFELNGFAFDLLITGMGTTFTAFHLTHTLFSSSYSLVVNAGLAGSLSEQVGIGEVVNVVEDEFADLGIQKEQEFLTLFKSGFMQPHEYPFENGILKADGAHLAPSMPRVKGITSNVSHGRIETILELKNNFSASVESMEGAAVLFVCRWLGVPCLQVRAVSNMVAPRSQSRWDIPLALENLRQELMILFAALPAGIS